MDKFFNVVKDVPVLPSARLEQMTEFALSHRQHVAGNENRKASFFSLRWASAFSATACVALVIGVLAFQSNPVAPAKVTTVADANKSYEDITDIALLQTLDSF